LDTVWVDADTFDGKDNDIRPNVGLEGLPEPENGKTLLIDGLE
jgi:hypothetical protein